MASSEEASRDEWALVYASSFATLAGMNSDVWASMEGAFVYHKSTGTARVQTTKLASNATESSLVLAVAPCSPQGWKDPLLRTIQLTAFTDGSVTELLVSTSYLQNLVDRGCLSSSCRIPLDRLCEEQRQRLDRLFSAVRSYADSPWGGKGQRDQAARPAPAHGVNGHQRSINPGGTRIAILEFCRQRDVSDLVHFTQLKNLASILKYGLLSRSDLKARLTRERFDAVAFNDEMRLDGQSKAVCLSVSFPNYSMFYKYRCRSSEPWAVLELKPDILWELECAFCPENAASSAVRSVPLECRQTANAFRSMFGDATDKPRRSLGIPDHFATHPQAEVLVFGRIVSDYITSVSFESPATLNAWAAHNGTRASCSLLADPTFFKPRCDWQFWSSNTNNV